MKPPTLSLAIIILKLSDLFELGRKSMIKRSGKCSGTTNTSTVYSLKTIRSSIVITKMPFKRRLA